MRQTRTWLCAAGALVLMFAHQAAAADPPKVDRDTIHRYLKAIVIPKLEFRRVSIPEAVGFLKQKSVAFDPDPDPTRRGVGIILRLPEGQVQKDAIGALPPPAAAPSVNGPAIISEERDETRITLYLTNIPLWEALRYIGEFAQLELKVGRSALELSPRDLGKKAPLATAAEARTAAAGAARIEAKLNRLIIPKLEFREVSPMEGVGFLSSGQRADEATHINIMYIPRPPTEKAPEPPSISLKLDGASLLQALREFARLADADLAVEEYAVVLRARPAKR